MEASSNIVLTSLTLGVLFLALGLSITDQRLRKDHRYLTGAFLALYAAIKLEELYIFLEGYKYIPQLLGITFAAKLMLGPTIYFYARALLSTSTIWPQSRDWPALLAPATAIIVALPFYVLPPSEKLALFSTASLETEQYRLAILGCQIGLTLFIITSLAYLGATHRLLVRHNQRVRNLFSRIEDKTVEWLRWIILVLAIGWSLDAAREIWYFSGYQPPAVFSIFQTFELIWIAFIVFYAVKQTPIEGLSEVAVSEDSMAANDDFRSTLSDERLKRIAKKLNQTIRDENLFRNPNLSLRALSDATGVSSHHLSETFRRHFAQNFFDYVNSLRVDLACDLLQSTRRNVLDIALDVGFNSRSTFNAAFKKHTNSTPRQYRKRFDTIDMPTDHNPTSVIK